MQHCLYKTANKTKQAEIVRGKMRRLERKAYMNIVFSLYFTLIRIFWQHLSFTRSHPRIS